MRLAQLARKLKIKSSDIVDFLEKEGVTLTVGSNSKIDKEHIDLLVAEFADPNTWDNENQSVIVPEEDHSFSKDPEPVALPDIIVEEEEIVVAPTSESLETEQEDNAEEEEEEEKPDIEINSAEENVIVNPEEQNTNSKEDPLTSNQSALIENISVDDSLPETSVSDVNESLEEVEENDELSHIEAALADPNTDVIKAPKANLPGLKVIGKISLPEPKAKEEDIKQEESDMPTKKKKKKNRNKKGKEGEWVNRLEQDRIRKKAREEKRTAEQREQLKTEKKDHYLTKVQGSYQVPVKKKKKKPVVKSAKSQTPERKSLFGKFIKWLNT